jgi:hypothetical protein
MTLAPAAAAAGCLAVGFSRLGIGHAGIVRAATRPRGRARGCS